MRTNGLILWMIMLLMLGISVFVLMGGVAAESFTWDTEEDFEDGEWEDTMWDPVEGAVKLDWESTWGKLRDNPVLKEGSGSSFDNTSIDDPHLMYAQGKYHLYYTAYNGTAYSIGHAVSIDGRSFTKDTSPVLQNGTGGEKDEATVQDPFVMYDEGIFKMWYGAEDTSHNWCIAYATSPDGTTWTKRSTAVLSQPSSGWGALFIRGPCVIKVGSEYWMYLDGNKVSTNRATIGLAKSTNGISFTMYSGNPILDFAPSGEYGAQRVLDPIVFRYNLGYQMLFSGSKVAGSATMRILRAFSYDGVNWWHDVGWFFDVEKTGSWDDYFVQSPSIFDKSGLLSMIFVGNNGSGGYAFGIAEYNQWLNKYPGNPFFTRLGGDYDSIFAPFIADFDGKYYHVLFGCNDSSGTKMIKTYKTESLDNRYGSSFYRVTPYTDDYPFGYPTAISTGSASMMIYYYNSSGVNVGWWSGWGGPGPQYPNNPILKKGISGSWQWDSTQIIDPWVIKDGSMYRMWYIGRIDPSTSGSIIDGIGYATSSNGISWAKYTLNPVISPNIESYAFSSPSVIKHNGHYEMFYIVDYTLFMANSLDGINWNQIYGGIMQRGPESSWDDYRIRRVSPFIQGSNVHFLYDAMGDYGAFGYATLNTTSGVYTTSILDTTNLFPVGWQTVSWDADIPTGTDVKFQIALNNGGDIWNFQGPDGTRDTYYNMSGDVLPVTLSGKYMRVRAYMSTENGSVAAPTLRSITVSYRQRPNPSPPTVTLTSPNGGEDWMKTKEYVITWTSQGNFPSNVQGTVLIYVSINNGSSWSMIASLSNNIEYHRWTVPSTETSGALIQIMLIDMDGQMAHDISDATFAIDPPPPKDGQFLTPATGEALTPGAREVSWAIWDPWGLADAPLTLEYTTDGGITWELIRDGFKLTDSTTWEVPELTASSDTCQLRLSILNWLGDISVIESGVFTIDVEAPTVTLTGPDGKVEPRRATIVTCTAEDDIGVTSVTLHVQGEDGERSYLMEVGEDGTWSYDYIPEEGDFGLYATASDGVHETQSLVEQIQLSGRTEDDGARSSLATTLLLAAGLAILITIVAFLARREK